VVAGESTNGQPHWEEEPGDDDVFSISSNSFEEQFGENILEALDVKRWRLGNDLDAEYDRLEQEVSEAEKIETTRTGQIRDSVLPRLAQMANAPRHAGKHAATRSQIESIHRGLLFNGGVEACDGMVQIHETLPLTVFQMGICLVSYRGDQGTWGQRLFRRDLKQKGVEVEELIDFLERRARREWPGQMPGQDQSGELIQKALLQHAERSILLERSEAAWRLGHGNPLTYELLTGGGNLELMVEATRVLRQLVEQYQKFVFIAGEPHEIIYRTIGQALHPLEFAIIETLERPLSTWLRQKRFGVFKRIAWDEDFITPAEWIPRVIERVASKIVVGLFRPTILAPAQLFYAHVDHSDIAGRIALADCVLKEQGTSMLLEMAQRVCTSTFGESLEALAESAYVAAGAHNRFLSGRFHPAR
jgi:hypothetical protein